MIQKSGYCTNQLFCIIKYITTLVKRKTLIKYNKGVYNMELDLKNKLALVTGSTKGIARFYIN